MTDQEFELKKKIVKGWIEVAEERMNKAKEVNDFSTALVQENYAYGLSQALVLFETKTK